jgi:hypothetical protein
MTILVVSGAILPGRVMRRNVAVCIPAIVAARGLVEHDAPAEEA